MPPKAPEKILLTGGTGFIGKRLVEKLSEAKIDTWAILRNPQDAPKKWISLTFPPHLVPLDLLDGDLLRRFDFSGFTHLIHMAASIPGAGQCGGETDFVENILMISNLTKALPSGSIHRMVFTSTLDVYGSEPLYLPIDEGHPLDPKTLYAVSKVASEHYLKLGLAACGIELTILRLSQVYGPGEPPIKALPKFIHAVKSGRPPTVYGTGLSVRDFVFVDDVVDAILLSIRSKECGTFNIATGKGITIGDAAETIIRLAGGSSVPEYRPSQGKDTRIVLDITRAREYLGYEPKTSFEEGLSKCFQAVDGTT